MTVKRFASFSLVLLLAMMQFSSVFANQAKVGGQSSAIGSADKTTTDSDQLQNEGSQSGNKKAGDAAAHFRSILPVVPSSERDGNGLLTPFGRRATQNQFVSSTNVKDHATDIFPFRGSFPIEAAEDVVIPSEQFTVSLAKLYFTVPTAIRLKDDWHFSLANPYFSFKHEDGIRGIRSANPRVSLSSPLLGGRFSLFNSFEYRVSKRGVESAVEEDHDIEGSHENDNFHSDYQSYDWHTFADWKAGRSHILSTRFALYSQEIDAATLNAVTELEATPDYLMRGGSLYFADNFTASGGAILSSSIEINRLRLRVLPRGDEPMALAEQHIEGNYFDTLRRSSSRIEWKESLRLPERDGWGRHLMSFGGGLSRRAFDSRHVGNKIIFTGDDEDDLHSTITFTGSPFESFAARKWTGWAEDRWSPLRRAQVTLGLRYDWHSISRMNQWSPRVGVALLPFKTDRTVIRGGIGVFYDRMPLNAATFERSRQRVVQFFDEGEPLTEPRALVNLTSAPRLKTSHLLGWNLELDQQVMSKLFLRVKAEDRRGKNILLIAPDDPTDHMSALILSDNGTSRYRELEFTTSYRPSRWTDVNASYIHSSSVGDRNTFVTSMDTFEKLFIGKARYGRSLSDVPHRFLAWGNVQLPGGFTLSPAFESRTGHIFSFIDGDADVPNDAEFGRFPRLVSLDLGGYRDFKVRAFGRESKLRLGFRAYNLTNHFNPQDAFVGENEDETEAVLKGFLNSPGRSYRLSLTLDF